MSAVPRRQLITTSPDRPLQRGQISEISRSEQCRVDNVDTKSSKIQKESKKKNRGKSVTVEYLQMDKKTISNDKSSTCDASIQTGQSCLTSGADSTGTGKTLEPFFNGHCKEMSRRLRSLIETDRPDSDSRLSNSCWHKKELGSSATHMTTINHENKNWSRISFQLSRSSVRRFMADGTTGKEKQTRIRTIQVFPTPTQKQTLKKWFDDCRYTYNTCVAHERNHGIKTRKSHFQWLRNRFVTSKNIPSGKKWLKDTPKHVREGSVKDFVTSRKSAFTNLRNGNIRKFNINFRKKENTQSIVIPKDFVTSCDKVGIRCYPRILKGILLTRYKVPKVTHDCRLVYKSGAFFLQVPIDVAVSKKACFDTGFCAIDPGERTFATVWSEKGVSEFGSKFGASLFSRLVAMDKLRSKIDAERSKRKKARKKQAFNKLSNRMQNILKDFHYKVASSLCDEYDNIVIPKFGITDMISKKNRRLRTKTVRQMTCLGHAKFRERLMDVASRRGKNVFVVSEEYTSKTCCSCGTLNEKLGSSRTFTCGQCDFSAPRDVHAAFNIFLKFMKENSAELSVEEHQRLCS